jgi:23S rRNA pseudouridine2605 synthase
MEDNKRGTRKRIVRRPAEGHAEKVDYSTSRSFDSGERPHRSYSSDRPRRDGEDRPRKSGYGKPSFGGSSKPGFRSGKPGFKSDKPGFKSDRPGFKGGKPGVRKPYAKRSQADEGMNAMLSRKPQVNGRYSDDDTAPTEIKEVVRLNKFIANSGVCSRREADTMIQAGVVTVNGEVVTELGTKVNVFNDVVKFNGETLRGEAKVYLVMNKPRGYVTTASDPHAEKTVMDLLKACTTRVYPVGRLDKATTGVLMFTNDGEIAERLTHPSYDKKKIYQVTLNRPLTDEDRDRILAGLELSDGPMAADALEFIDENDHRKAGIEIHSGKNRVVRRLFEAAGYEVRALDRVYFAGLTKKGLKKGEWRYLTESEVNILKMGAYV